MTALLCKSLRQFPSRTLSGKNDGSVNGKRYFQCKKPYGSFVRPSTVRLLRDTGPVSSESDNDENNSPAASDSEKAVEPSTHTPAKPSVDEATEPSVDKAIKPADNEATETSVDLMPKTAVDATKKPNTIPAKPLSGKAHTRVHQVTNSSAVLIVRMGVANSGPNPLEANPPSVRLCGFLVIMAACDHGCGCLEPSYRLYLWLGAFDRPSVQRTCSVLHQSLKSASPSPRCLVVGWPSLSFIMPIS